MASYPYPTKDDVTNFKEQIKPLLKTNRQGIRHTFDDSFTGKYLLLFDNNMT